MRRIYLVPLLLFLIGLSLIAASTSSRNEVSLLGLVLMAQVVRGLGLIVIIFSIITLLAAYGSMLPPKPQETRRSGGDRPRTREEPAKQRKFAETV